MYTIPHDQGCDPAVPDSPPLVRMQAVAITLPQMLWVVATRCIRPDASPAPPRARRRLSLFGTGVLSQLAVLIDRSPKPLCHSHVG
jgi:hypothetical protein